ncbi:MAG: hypothetical protein ABJB12_18840 [Pseudomonadota bacterium]
MKPLLLALLCASLLGPRSARATEATPGAARIAISKGAGTAPCMSENALRHAVEARLRRAVFPRDLPVTLVVQVAFERTAAGWSAELTMHDGSGQFLGQRSIVTEAAHCSALDDSLALVVALLVDSPPSAPTVPAQSASPPAAPAQLNETNEPRSTPAPSAAQFPGKPAEPQPFTTLEVPRDTLAPREPWRFNVSLSAVAALGTIPGLASGAELGIGAQAPHLPELRLFADGFGQRDQQRSARSGAHFELASLGLELCALDARLGALHWFGCAGQSLGRLKAASYGFDRNTSSQHLTYALSVRTGLGFPLFGRLQGRMGARAELPLSRAIFDYGSRDGSERELYEVKAITAALDLGLIVRL